MTRIADRIRDRWWLRLQAEAGQGLVEYTLILSLVALGCVAALTLLGTTLQNSPGFTQIPAAL